jgi:homoserine O-succinyltransferase/O-acetyltransferase
MPIAIQGGRVPILLQRAKAFGPPPSPSQETDHPGSDTLRIALINNMPDAALEDTELQFFELLSGAATDTKISLKLFSLPNVPRSDLGRQHLNHFYAGINELFSSRFDAVIITGTEPKRPDLREEPYWPALVEVLSWAENNTSSAVLSCLAAHAGVLARDGIPRTPLSDKQFGVFEYKKVSAHALTEGIADSLRMPHSRWNEVKTDALAACGYQVLTQSATAGSDLFVKQTRQSLFVHFQGHPEYGTRTLLKEYRRDIKRFLRGERPTYPSMPHGYFGPLASQLLADFEQKVLTNPGEQALADFPEVAVGATVQNSWQATAGTVYRNWLQYLQSKKAEQRADVAMAPVIRA